MPRLTPALPPPALAVRGRQSGKTPRPLLSPGPPAKRVKSSCDSMANLSEPSGHDGHRGRVVIHGRINPGKWTDIRPA